VHGSGVLDARKQRLRLLSARADVNVEDFEPAVPLRHLVLALEKVEQHAATLEQNTQRLERRHRRRRQDRRAQERVKRVRCYASPTSSASACWPIMSSARGDLFWTALNSHFGQNHESLSTRRSKARRSERSGTRTQRTVVDDGDGDGEQDESADD
jgi:hypothetical protein